MSVIPFVSCPWMRRTVHVAFDMLMLDSKPYFYVDYMIPLLQRFSNWCSLDGSLIQSESDASGPIRALNTEKKHLKTSLEPCTFWKQNLSVLTFLSFWPLLTKPTPTQQWSGIISYLCFETFFWIFDCSICSRQTVLCSGANSRFSYTDSEYNYGATKIIFPIINQKI